MTRFLSATALAGPFAALALAATGAPAGPATAPEWLTEAKKFLPDGYVLGQVIAESPDGAEVTVAVFPASANDPSSPGSVFEPGQALDVLLQSDGGGVIPIAGAFQDREPVAAPLADPGDRSEESYAYLHREIWTNGQWYYPTGTEACDLRGWSIDENASGLNVYLKPSTDSRLLGTLPPRYRFDGATEAAPEEGFFTEFDIIGYRDGWFMIEHAEPPGRAYAYPDTYPDDHPEPFAGRGWISADRVGAQYANGDMPVRATDENGVPVGGLYQAPSIDAAWTPARNEFGGPISADGGPKRILACSGLWALVESHDGVVGWWRRLCSSQVTNCS
jgi:hypothetical protein